jgi:guanylate kinase
MAIEKNGMMFVLSSPSGAGKTTLTKRIAEQNSDFKISISHTTRKPRPNEIDGKDYYFVKKEEFDDLIKQNSFFEYASIFDNRYGTQKKPVTEILSKGQNVLFDIDWQGTKQLKEIANLTIATFFILPPNLKVLKERLLNRHSGQENLVNERMNKFHEELSHWNEYDYIFVNDNLDDCYNDILQVIKKIKFGKSIKQDIEIVKMKIKELSN